jgi:hypothetical protein
VLGALRIAAAQRLDGETFLLAEDNSFRQARMARVGDIVLLHHPADATGPRSINAYLVEVEDAAALGADGKKFKIEPARLVYSLRWLHKAEPPDFELVLMQDKPRQWVNAANLRCSPSCATGRPRRSTEALCRTSCDCSTPSKRRWKARSRGGIDGRAPTSRSSVAARIWTAALGARTAATSRRINARADGSPFAHALRVRGLFLLVT